MNSSNNNKSLKVLKNEHAWRNLLARAGGCRARTSDDCSAHGGKLSQLVTRAVNAETLLPGKRLT